MKFTLTIELGNDAMRTAWQVHRALWQVGDRINNYNDGPMWESVPPTGTIADENGAHVGKWEVSESIEVREDIQQDSIATLLWDYLKRDPDNKDRRQTGYGTKTKQGLYLSISSILKQTGGLR